MQRLYTRPHALYGLHACVGTPCRHVNTVWIDPGIQAYVQTHSNSGIKNSVIDLRDKSYIQVSVIDRPALPTTCLHAVFGLLSPHVHYGSGGSYYER